MNVAHYYRDVFEWFEFRKEGESDIPVYWKTDREKTIREFEANAIEILDGYRRKRENIEADVLYAEQEFRVKIAGYWFTGTIDQLRRNADGTLELIDFKSGRQQPTVAFLHNDWQLNLYLYALRYGEVKVADEWFKPKLLPDFTSWYFLRGHELRKRTTINGNAGEEKGPTLIRTEKGLMELRRFRKEMEMLLKVMLRDWHFPNTNHCQICNYTRYCLERDQILPEDIVSQARKILEETDQI